MNNKHVSKWMNSRYLNTTPLTRKTRFMASHRQILVSLYKSTVETSQIALCTIQTLFGSWYILASSHGHISNLLRTSLVWSSRMSRLEGVLTWWSRSFLIFRREWYGEDASFEGRETGHTVGIPWDLIGLPFSSYKNQIQSMFYGKAPIHVSN